MTDENTVDEAGVPPTPEPPKPPKPPAPKPTEPNQVQVPQPWSSDPSQVIEHAPPKSPVAAALLSLVPFGLGHLYLGQYARALAFFVGFWVPLLILGLPLLGVFFYFLGIFDAFRQAQLINLAAREGHELPAGAFKGSLAAGVFLVVLGGVLIGRKWIDFYLIREFLQDWWPALLVLVGVYFIYGAIRENRDSGESDEIDSF